jgi:transglutaminase-like putative cysteine protease
MRFLCCLYFLLSLSGVVFSQDNSPVIFGKPNPAEVSAKTCSLDSSADAEMLYDKETIEFFVNINDQYCLRTTYHGKLKIYKKSGLNRGTIKFKQKKRDGDKQTVESIKGFTYNEENGKIEITALTKGSIFNEKVNDFESVTKIVAPNLKEGSVFDYTFTYITPFSVSNRPNSWFFQGEMPNKWSELSIVIPGRFFYKLFYHGYLPLYINEIKDTTVKFHDDLIKAVKYRYVVKNAPAFVGESLMASYQGFVAKLEFELASYTPPFGGTEMRFTETWDDINKGLVEDGNFGERLNNTGFLKEVASKFDNIPDTMEKVKAAFRYVSQTIKWNGYSDLYIVENLNKAFENKTGTNVQINMILVALLRRLNIEANPAIISTRSNGEVNEQFPLRSKFNYMIAQAKVGGKDIVMDATERFSKPNMLPYKSLATKMFVIGKEHGRMINYPSKEKKLEMETIDYIIKPEVKEIQAKCQVTFSGYKAFEMKNFIYSSGEEGYRKYVKNSNPDWQIENIMINNKDSVFDPLKVSYDVVVTNYSETADRLFFNPFFSHTYKENPLKQTSRIYPLDLVTPTEDIVLISVKIPEGYVAEELPKSSAFVLPDKSGKFSYVVETESDVVKIRSQLSINKRFFEPQEYAGLRELYGRVMEKQAQQIVLKKK